MIGLEGIPRLREAWQRIFGAEEVQPPGFTLEQDRLEWSYVKHEVLAWAGSSVAAVVGQNARMGVRNPSGSNLLVVIEEAWISGAIASMGINPTVDITSNLTAFARDTRNPLNNPGGVFAAFDTNATTTYSQGPSYWLAAQAWSPVNCVLKPGDMWAAILTSVNIASQMAVKWRLRRARSEELAIEI